MKRLVWPEMLRWHIDPQDCSPQCLEDLATAYWYSEVLFAAVEMDLFSLLEQSGKTAAEIADALGFSCQGTGRFLAALRALGLVMENGGCYYNTAVSSEYLVRGKNGYQGNSILWRKMLVRSWRGIMDCLKAGGRVDYPEDEDPEEQRSRIHQYIRAMDDVAREKTKEIVPFFEGLFPEGELLDVGCGSGAVAAGFMERFPSLKGTLVDLPVVLEFTKSLIRERGCGGRVSYCGCNILEPWPLPVEHFDLVILSNIVHAYSQREIPQILKQAARCLNRRGFLLVHDFFPEHYPEKAALFDLNMLINTYNGRIFPADWVRNRLADEGLFVTELVPLKSDTALIVASKDRSRLANLRLDPVSRLVQKIYSLGFKNVVAFPPRDVQVSDWVDLRCRFGCSYYGSPHCPPNSPTPEKTRKVLGCYSSALLLEGEPPTGKFQRLVLDAEREAFLAGYHKALAFWAGPCSLCKECASDGKCRSSKHARPSMEASGIDVFETVRRAGLSVRTLKDRAEYVKYFALLLLE